MERAQKETIVGSIKELNVESVTKLRDEFRKSGVEYKVVKNTLVKKAIEQHGWAKNLKMTLTGMTGIAFSYEDPSAAAKVVRDFRKTHEKLKVKAGLIEGQVLAGEAVESQLA